MNRMKKYFVSDSHHFFPARKKFRAGFTLIEILVVIGMIAILAAVVLIAINPLHQFAEARNSQRISNVNAILNAVGSRLAENKGVFESPGVTCPSQLPTGPTNIAKTSGYNLRGCLVPVYMPEIPVDPTLGSNSCTTTACDGPGESYDTNYTIEENPLTSRITVCAPSAAEPDIQGAGAYCLSR